MFIKPAKGKSVRNPETMRLLPEEGAEVVMTDFWSRRLRDGDVVESKTSTKKSPVVAPDKE